MAKFNEFTSVDELNEHFAQQIVVELAQAIEHSGRASLVVSGGKTPIGLFEILNQQPLSWDKVYITLADERWVESENHSSNEKLVYEHLLKNHLAKAHFVGLKNSCATPFEGAMVAEQALKSIPTPFDVVLLGMGDDGHTASLFPGAANLLPALALDSDKLCLGMTPLTAPHDRITLTLPALLNSRHIYLHITGNNKRGVYLQALSGNSVMEMPIRAILQQSHVPVDVMWTA